jgi:hypothetical protein
MTDTSSLATFPPEVRLAVDGLMYLGYLTDSFSFAGHKFSIRTLYGNEELLADKLVKEYIETTGQARAYAWSRVALALISVDGREDFCPPIGPDEWEYAQGRFQYVTSKWFWPLGEYIFNRFAELQQRQVEAIRAVQDLSTRSLRNSTPSPDSLTEPGDSNNETSTDAPS